jgi:hypothetical protein
MTVDGGQIRQKALMTGGLVISKWLSRILEELLFFANLVCGHIVIIIGRPQTLGPAFPMTDPRVCRTKAIESPPHAHCHIN